MRKSLFAIAAVAALVSCQSLIEEWQPVFTFSNDNAAEFTPVDMHDRVNATIAEVKAKYTEHGSPVILGDMFIEGQVVSSDEDGNIYREIYIQDATGGLCVKLGRSSSYDDFKLGQMLYIDCEGLCIGEYGYKEGTNYGGGILQLGVIGDGWKEYSAYKSDPAAYQSAHPEDEYPSMYDSSGNFMPPTEPEYESSYLDLVPIINKHIFKGRILPESERVTPAKPADSALKGTGFKNPMAPDPVAVYTKLEGLRIGNSKGEYEVFALLYPDSNLNHDKNNAWNRLFLSNSEIGSSKHEYPFNLTHWALTKHRTQIQLRDGDWDNCVLGDSGKDSEGHSTVATRMVNEKNFGYEGLYKDVLIDHATAQSVSHYFQYGSAVVQIRSSGYSRFADVELPVDVLDKSRTIDVVGIMSRYQGSPQFLMMDAFYSGTTISLIKNTY